MQKEICEKLERINKNNPDNYEKINKVLRFLYKTIQKEFFELKIYQASLSDEIYKDTHIGGNRNLEKELGFYSILKNSLYQNYVESSNGIVNMLFDMANDENQKYFEYFMEKIDTPLSMFENGITSKTESFLYIYNLYVMLKVYKTKNNFDNFKTIVDEVSTLFIDNDYPHSNEDCEKIGLLDQIIDSEFYPKLDLLRDLMVNTLLNIRKYNNEGETKRLYSMFTYLGELTRDKMKYGKLGYIGYTIKPEIFDIISHDVTLLAHKDLLPGCEPFYDPIILFGDRYKVLKENIKVVDVNHREEVYSYFVCLCPGFFDELNQNREKDIFNDCVEKIFDSDTYSELYRKLEIFSQADGCFQKGDKKVAIEKVKILMTESFKEKVLGNELCFPTDNNNKIEKPNSIAERTKVLYLKHDLVSQDFNWDVLERCCLQVLKEVLDTEVFEYNAQKQITIQEQVKPELEEPKQKKKSRFSLFG